MIIDSCVMKLLFFIMTHRDRAVFEADLPAALAQYADALPCQPTESGVNELVRLLDTPNLQFDVEIGASGERITLDANEVVDLISNRRLPNTPESAGQVLDFNVRGMGNQSSWYVADAGRLDDWDSWEEEASDGGRLDDWEA